MEEKERNIKGMKVIKKILKKYKNLVNSIVERMLGKKKQQSKMCKKCCYMALLNVSFKWTYMYGSIDGIVLLIRILKDVKTTFSNSQVSKVYLSQNWSW